MVHRWVRLAASAAAVFCCGAASATNLLTNGGFDVDTSGWSANVGNSTSYGGYDSSVGYTSPGSAFIVVGSPGDSIHFTQCVDITPQNVDLVFYSKVNYTGGGPNIGTGSVSFFDQAGCGGSYISNQTITKVETLAGGWKRQTLLNFAAPATTLSAMVFIENSVQQSDDGSAGVDFDDVGFGPTGTFYTPAVSDNLLTNPEFDYDMSSWNNLAPGNANIYTAWFSTGGYGSPGSLSMTAISSGDSVGVYQCVNIAAQSIDLQVYSRIDFTGGGTNTGTASVSSFDTPNCSSTYVENTVAPIVSTDQNGWSRHALINHPLPASTQSAMVFFTLSNKQKQNPWDTSMGLHVDHFGFGATGTFADVVFKNGFE